MMTRRYLAVFGTAVAINLVAGCAGITTANSPKDSNSSVSRIFNGRISLVIEPEALASSAQAQAFSGSFEWRGNAQTGELDLLTPLGSIAAQLRWMPDMAVLIRGNERQAFASAQALLEQATGASFTMEQLFAWLQGESYTGGSSGSLSKSASQWQVDLSARAEGRISARRSLPTPAQLRIILSLP